MRKLTLICVMAVLCSGLVCAQKKPRENADSQEKNKATARAVFEDLWTRGRYELISSMYEPNAMVHYPNESIPLSKAVENGKEWRSAFPDLIMRPEQVTEQGSIVVVRWAAQGTNTGHGKGLPGKGKPAKTQGTSKFRFDKEGKIAEVWVQWDENHLRKQVE